MKDIISVYKISESKTKEVWYIPKVNSEVFKDGNGIPLIRREVHEYTTFGKCYKVIGCNNTAEHECPLCAAYAEGMYKASTSIEETRKKIENYWGSKEKADEALKVFKQETYITVPFKKNDYVYMVVAVLDNYIKDEMSETEFVPSFTMQIVRMTVDVYNRDFRSDLLDEDTGVFFDISYENTENIINKSKSRAVTKSDIALSSIQKFDKRAVKEFKSLHMLDLLKLKPELGVASFAHVKSIVSAFKGDIKEFM